MRILLACTLVLLPTTVSQGDFGIVVMAHGGDEAWNRTVREALEPLRDEMPVALALGMADAASIERAAHELAARGVRRIGVVRLFISGDSWLQRTEQILGLAAGAPSGPSASADREPCPDTRQEDCPGADAAPAFYRISSSARFALSHEGLGEAPESARILLERALDLSLEPAREDVLVLAHGVGDRRGNAAWRQNMEARVALLRERIPFRRVRVETLAEDWPAARAEAEQRIRGFVRRAVDDRGRAIVIPFRLSGFGPYAEVLEGLEYVADGRGLLPHPAITDWIRRQAEDLRATLR